MATLIDDLIDVFDKQILLYNDLLAIGKEKKNVILENNIETLTTMNTVENTIISKINRLEKQRISVINDICEVLSINLDDFTLSNLSDSLNVEEDKNKVIKIKDELNAIIAELKKVNDVNKTLIESSLDYVNFSLNTLKSAREPIETGYENELKHK